MLQELLTVYTTPSLVVVTFTSKLDLSISSVEVLHSFKSQQHALQTFPFYAEYLRLKAPVIITNFSLVT
jgi:hypothetical protein